MSPPDLVGQTRREPLTTFDSDSVQYKPAFGTQAKAMDSLTTFESDSMSYHHQLSFGRQRGAVNSLTTFDSDSTVSTQIEV